MSSTNRVSEIPNNNYFIESNKKDWINDNVVNDGIYSGASNDHLRGGQGSNKFYYKGMIRLMII